MSCGGRVHPVNPERPGEPGRWKFAAGEVVPGVGACRIHTWQGRNLLGIVGGPVGKVCTGCGETHWPLWVRDTVVEIQVHSLTATRDEIPWPDMLPVEPSREAGKRGAVA